MSNTALGMATYSIQFKETDRQKIEALIEFVKSLDFVQSVDEIRRLHPNEWVLLGNPVSEGGVLLGGTVIFHDPEKRGMALRGKGLFGGYERATHFFAGEMPKRPAIGLMRKPQPV